jgi:predicted Zn-dependent protease
VGILAAIFTLGAAAAGGDPAAVATFGQAAAAGALASYSRDQEREADHYGQEYAQRADYDPSAMTAYFRTLEGLERLRTGASRYPSFFDTHPPTPERVAATSARAESLARRGGAPGGRDRAAYLRRVAGTRIGPNPEEGVFEEQRFIHLDLGVTLRFPDGWRTQNSRREVAALAPREDAVIRLELQGPGNDAEAAAAAFVNANRLPVHEAKAVRIGGAPAFHVLASAPYQGTALAVDLTFVAREGLIYRITGLTPGERYAAYQGVFRATAHGFRSPTDDERSGIEGLRLAIVEAKAGETLAALSERSGNRWSLRETAVANGLPAEEPLAAGELVKVAVAEAFTGSRPAASGSGAPDVPPQ